MRIGVVSTMDGYPWGGSEELWAEAARAALRDRLSVGVSVNRWPSIPPGVARLSQEGAQVFSRLGPRSRVGRVARRFRSPFAALGRFRPDVLCISQGGVYDFDYTPGLVEFVAATGAPYVVVCQCNNDLWIPGPDRRRRAIDFFGRAARVVFVSEQNRRLAERQLAAPLANALVCRNPVKLPDTTALPWSFAGRPRLASVARLEVGYKGQDILFEALASPVWRARDWTLSLYGSGPDRDYIAGLAEHYDLVGHVRLAGFVEDVRAIWAESELLVLSSRAEGTPLSLVEAMLCGRPAVVTDVGGNAEWVEEGKTGFIAEAPTARLFGAALERAWAARDRWPDMGRAAHERAVMMVDPEPGRTLLAVLRSVAGPR